MFVLQIYWWFCSNDVRGVSKRLSPRLLIAFPGVCLSKLSASQVLIFEKVAIVTRGSVILADTIVIIATWSTLHGQLALQEALSNYGRSTSMVLLADGASVLLFLYPHPTL